MKTLLITGFEPFGGETINPAWEAVKALPEQIGGWQLRKLHATEPESEPAEEVITEPVTEAPQAPEPEPVSEPEPVKSPVVDLNNTNRNLTPDEIAALFSSM